MMAKITKDEREDIVLLQSQPFEDEKMGKGWFSHRKLSVVRNFPDWVKRLLSGATLEIEEKSWDCYPLSKAVYIIKTQWTGILRINVLSNHLEDNGSSHNVHNLSSKDLSERSVQFIDIVNTTPPRWSGLTSTPVVPTSTNITSDSEMIATSTSTSTSSRLVSQSQSSTYDPQTYVSQKAKRGPLNPDWISSFRPIMCAYKLVSIDYNSSSGFFRSKVISLVHEVIRDVFFKVHRQTYFWLDEWYDMDMGQIKRFEKEVVESLPKVSPSRIAQPKEKKKKKKKKKYSALIPLLPFSL
eukprot:TRINITY_DN5302_c0_g1_i18.p1 TRINITY_DN5302_c0_g1~~TRINITY_DN5302_c0_g1_i18.p1  ORF type:complete len:297 (+),score=55.72 TRINITY_DN5302_c0_g1_i18:754-1644(+)